jgi:hypothetical protein
VLPETADLAAILCTDRCLRLCKVSPGLPAVHLVDRSASARRNRRLPRWQPGPAGTRPPGRRPERRSRRAPAPRRRRARIRRQGQGAAQSSSDEPCSCLLLGLLRAPSTQCMAALPVPRLYGRFIETPRASVTGQSIFFPGTCFGPLTLSHDWRCRSIAISPPEWSRDLTRGGIVRQTSRKGAISRSATP